MKFFNILAIAALATPAVSFGQTVTVNKTATPDATTFNSISAALAAVEADAAEPNVVQVTDDGVYEEVFNITSPVVIEGTGSERPVLEVLGNANGTGANGGILINLPSSLTTGTVKLKNLVILPATGTAPNARLRTAIENQNNNLYLEIDNVLITANNGNHEPLVTDGIFSDVLKLVPTNVAYDPNVIPFGAHGIVLGRTQIGSLFPHEGAGVELLFNDSIITHLRNDYHPAATEPERVPTCIVVHSPYASENPDTSLVRKTHIRGSSAISHSRVGLSVVGDLEMSSDDRIYLQGHGNYAIRLDGPAFNYRTISDVTFTLNSAYGILDRGFGPIRWTMSNCQSIFTLNTIIRVETSGGPAIGLITIEDSTLVGGRNHPTAGQQHTIRVEPGTECDILFRNTILGGKMNHSQPVPVADPNNITAAEQALINIRNFNVISIAGNNEVTFEGTAVISEGPYAFRTAADGTSLAFSFAASATRVGEPTTGADPLFVFVDQNFPDNPGLLDVQNEVYATANADGGPLSGGADYIGGLSNVSDWAIY